MKIKVFVRHCKFSSNSAHKNNRPHYFTREGCFNNLLNTIDKDCDVTVSFDGNLTESDHFLNKDIYKGKFNLFQKKGGNDGSSFLNMIEYVNTLQFDDNDIIYFLEDDYFHNIGWTNIMREGFESVAVDYITLYDHNDKYIFKQSQGTIEKHGLEPHWGMYKDLKSEIICTGNKHWRTVPSTCDSFILSRDVFLRDYKHHSLGLFDAASFGLISKEFDLTIYSPIVGLSTHAQKPFISPCVNWEDVLDKTINLHQSMQDDRI